MEHAGDKLLEGPFPLMTAILSHFEIENSLFEKFREDERNDICTDTDVSHAVAGVGN